MKMDISKSINVFRKQWLIKSALKSVHLPLYRKEKAAGQTVAALVVVESPAVLLCYLYRIFHN
jgi:hypothetical protein